MSELVAYTYIKAHINDCLHLYHTQASTQQSSSISTFLILLWLFLQHLVKKKNPNTTMLFLCVSFYPTQMTLISIFCAIGPEDSFVEN